jgi:hypothetical protein
MALVWMLVYLVVISPCLLSLELNAVPVNYDHSPDLAVLASHRLPFVLAEFDVVRRLQARRWTLAHVAEQLPVVPAYMQINNTRFRTFHDNKELEPYLTKDRWTGFNRKVNVRSCVGCIHG